MLLVPLRSRDGAAELSVAFPRTQGDACPCRALLPEQGTEQRTLPGGAGGVGQVCLDEVNGAERTCTGRSWGGSGTSVGGSVSVPFSFLLWTKTGTESGEDPSSRRESHWWGLSTVGEGRETSGAAPPLIRVRRRPGCLWPRLCTYNSCFQLL